jgi:hypothetical protein
MSVVNKLVFRCDAPDCKSYCELHPDDADKPEKALPARGWTVMTGHRPGQSGQMHLCPAHGDVDSIHVKKPGAEETVPAGAT